MTQHHGFPRKVKSTSGSAPGSAPPLPPPNKAHSETSQHHVGGRAQRGHTDALAPEVTAHEARPLSEHQPIEVVPNRLTDSLNKT